MWGLSDEGKDVGDCERDYTGRSGCSLHREGLSGSRHTICKHRSVIALHNAPDQTFGSRIINLGVVFLWIKDIICSTFSYEGWASELRSIILTIKVIASFFPTV